MIAQVTGNPFFTVALPIMLTVAIASWSNNKRLDDICRRLDALEARILSIEVRLTSIERRLDALELKSWVR